MEISEAFLPDYANVIGKLLEDIREYLLCVKLGPFDRGFFENLNIFIQKSIT